MDDIQQAKADSFDRVAAFNTKYATIIAATITEYAAEQTIFDAANAQVHAAAVKQANRDTQGATQNADSLKLAMANTVIKYCERAKVKAHQLGNLTLEKALDHGYTFIYIPANEEALARAGELRDLLNNNLATLTNVTAANILEIDGTISAFGNAKDDTKEIIDVAKSSGTDALPDYFPTADKAMDNMFALIKSYFGYDLATKPMVTEMHLAMDQTPHGRHHNNLDFEFLDQNGQEFQGIAVQMYDEDNVLVPKKRDVSNIAGQALINNMRLGLYRAEFSGPEIATRHLNPIKIERGKTKVIHVQLTRITPP